MKTQSVDRVTTRKCFPHDIRTNEAAGARHAHGSAVSVFAHFNLLGVAYSRASVWRVMSMNHAFLRWVASTGCWYVARGRLRIEEDTIVRSAP